MTEFGRVITQNEHNLHNGNFKFVNLPFERGEIFSQRAFSIYTDIRKLQDKAKTSYTNSRERTSDMIVRSSFFMFEVGSGSESEHNGSEDPSCAERQKW
ncbi:MAG: hypothetical protein EGP89_01830 [Ruminococcaceae bacterium]|nr:hypothetical protein [Oscillospiraceae bacterium]